MRPDSAIGLALLACVSAGCNAKLGPTTPDRNWVAVSTAHVDLHARPGTFAERSAPTLGAVLDDQYETTGRLLRAEYAGRISGFLYNDAADAGLDGQRSGTAFPDTGAFKATATPPLDVNLYSLVQHEANHVLMGGTIGRAGTHLLNEGLASALVSERYGSASRRFYYSWTRAHKSQVIDVGRLADDDEWPHLPQDLAYSFAASFTGWLLDAEGPEKL